MDIYICGTRDRNRSLQGDHVVVRLSPPHEWMVCHNRVLDYLPKLTEDEFASLYAEKRLKPEDRLVVDAARRGRLGPVDAGDLEVEVASPRENSGDEGRGDPETMGREPAEKNKKANRRGSRGGRKHKKKTERDEAGSKVAGATPGSGAAPSVRPRGSATDAGFAPGDPATPALESAKDAESRGGEFGATALVSERDSVVQPGSFNRPATKPVPNPPHHPLVCTEMTNKVSHPIRTGRREEVRRSAKEAVPDSGLDVLDLLRLPCWKKLVQRTGKVVYIVQPVHTRMAAGHLKLMADKNPDTALFSPKDNRIPRMKIPMAECPGDFYRNEAKYSKTLFVALIVEWNDPGFAKGHDLFAFHACREECIFTIDPETARDLDDAVSCERAGNGLYEVGVHIADVSFFVPEDTPLDQEARNRATSVYMVQKVIPMLPRPLCENVCSLNPSEDRLALSVVWTVDADGNVRDERFGRSIIRSCVKLSYGHAQSIIDARDLRELDACTFPPVTGSHDLAEVYEKVKMLHGISQKLRARRFRNGALRLDQPKLSFTLDHGTGMPNGFFVYELKESNRLIEELMLLANMAAAHRIYRAFPHVAVLRNHVPPQENMLENLREVLAAYGIVIDTSSSTAIQTTLDAYAGKGEFNEARLAILVSLFAKPMQLAKYFCTGMKQDEAEFHHYALNVPMYTHFTSPIRRYPDVLVHRLLAASLGYTQRPTWDPYVVQRVAEHCNTRKEAAKRCSEMSSELFLAAYVRQCGPVYAKGMVLAVMDHSLDVLIYQLGIVKRVYLDSIIDARDLRELDACTFPPVTGSHDLAEVYERVKMLHGISQKLRARRFRNGALRLDQPKLSFTLDHGTGMPNGFFVYELKESNRLIEELMLLANMAAAHRIYRAFPHVAVLRNHVPPQENMLENLREVLAAYGIVIDTSSSTAIQTTLDAYAGKGEFNEARLAILVSLFAKPMQLAKYFCTGMKQDEAEFHHYALNVPMYTHFTSPIRRYPDVLVHRLLAASLGYTQRPTWDPYVVQRVAEHCNTRKEAAKRCSEMSSELFLAAYVRQCGPVYAKGMVLAVMDHSLDVLIYQLGIVKRVYLDKLDLKKFHYQRLDGIPELLLSWEKQQGDGEEKGEEVESVTIFTLLDVVLASVPGDPYKFVAIVPPPQDRPGLSCRVASETPGMSLTSESIVRNDSFF
ncbi:unnamed protein product [Darwinula stevensoni]|uniref:RNB domain-containing protein n=1 Tax=Darwinula stevensoni TaxID=69355 RepID=A0A7R9A9Q0_9CRUS|nr:unnamed protein product [Darwinula stevensoni]CAG0897653.1 unnamed protein product [Darwinula stevensoni]